MIDITKQSDVSDIALANAAVLNTNKFKTGDAVKLRHQGGQVFTVLGYAQDPRTKEVRVVLCWMGEDDNLREAPLPEDLLYAKD